MRKKRAKRVFVIRRKYLAAVALVLAASSIFYLVYHPSFARDNANSRSVPIYSVLRDDPVISLSFNLSAANDAHTHYVMNILNAKGVQATFFVTGQWLRENETLASALFAAGHELMNLTDDHTPLRGLSTDAVRESLRSCSGLIAGITGSAPSLFRAPYGSYDTHLVALAQSLGMHTVQWSVDSGDWRGISPEAIVRNVTQRAVPGGIVLMHSNLEQTATALPHVIRALLDSGFEIVPVSELVLEGEFVISLTGRQIPA